MHYHLIGGLIDELAYPPISPLEPVPRDGDVLVARVARPNVRFTIRQLPGIEQLSLSARDKAIRLSRSVAQKQSVDIWYVENGAYRLLEAYRPRSSSRQSN